ncbi:FMN-binding negative transcriptional regulator [Altererythrobacter sp.]|uniref:FMN-binding negative transcriptional regulator n=1 Tax=Altererythrobacter sp. TaxID=1872480 RepID=UPI003D07E7E4
MHPNPVFRHDDPALHQALVNQIGFGMIFCQTPGGPRVAHTPLLLGEDGMVRFHLSGGNALAMHLDGSEALAVLNGPEGYVSPRWYADQGQVPTWNYVALELEGTVQRMDREGLVALLDALSAREEARIEGKPWTRDKMNPVKFEKMLGAIIGFEMDVREWRPTFKLSQNKNEAERARVIEGLEARGAGKLAAMMWSASR